MSNEFCMTKIDELHNELSKLTPVGEHYDRYVSNFFEELTVTFDVNKKNVDLAVVKDILARYGFYIISEEHDKGVAHIRVKEVI